MESTFSRATFYTNKTSIHEEEEDLEVLKSKSVANKKHSTELTEKLRHSYTEMRARVKKKLRKMKEKETEAQPEPSKSKYIEIEGCARIKKNLLDLKTLPAGTVLNTKRRTRLDKLREEIPKPKRYVPPAHLPNWGYLPLDMKLPLVDAENTLRFSRGTLGQPLTRKFRKSIYTLYDPHNLERVIKDYNSLHDPHVKTFAKQPGVKKLLKKRGFIGDDDEVFCTVGQFNQYRLYLNHHQPDLRNKIFFIDNIDRNIRNQNNILHKYNVKQDGRGARAMRRVRENQQRLYSDRLNKLTAKEAEDDDRLEKLRLQNAQRLEVLRERNAEMERKRDENFARAYQMKKERRSMNFIRGVQKEIIFAARVKRRKLLAREVARQNVLLHLSERYEHQKASRLQAIEIEQALEEDFKVKSKEVQKKAEYQRKVMTRLIARKKAAAERVIYLMDKYFNLWRDNVRKRRSLKPDESHLSTWDVDSLVSESLGYIRHMSGYETFDNIVVNILKLKFLVQKELTEEEKDEQEEIKLAQREAEFLESKDELALLSCTSFKSTKSATQIASILNNST